MCSSLANTIGKWKIFAALINQTVKTNGSFSSSFYSRIRYIINTITHEIEYIWIANLYEVCNFIPSTVEMADLKRR